MITELTPPITREFPAPASLQEAATRNHTP